MTTTFNWCEGEWDGFAAFPVGKVFALLSLQEHFVFAQSQHASMDFSCRQALG